ncbi:unnamed protein product [Pleuronectes platessa]|uniref:Uncharacterized protein n=1 Tax=Pleuronectes platessa TaxID=8262 RepID=A0A9N7VS08_PLEPL|nr:unnamed protein product [Pleuronectes platessa]
MKRTKEKGKSQSKSPVDDMSAVLTEHPEEPESRGATRGGCTVLQGGGGAFIIQSTVIYSALTEGTRGNNSDSITVDELSAPPPLPPSLHGAVPLKTDMKTKPGHSGAPEAGPLADAATRPTPLLLPLAPGPEDSPEANRPGTQ